MVRGAILAEWSNSGVGSGLLWKIEIGRQKKRKEGEKQRRTREFEGAWARRQAGGGCKKKDIRGEKGERKKDLRIHSP